MVYILSYQTPFWSSWLLRQLFNHINYGGDSWMRHTCNGTSRDEFKFNHLQFMMHICSRWIHLILIRGDKFGTHICIELSFVFIELLTGTTNRGVIVHYDIFAFRFVSQTSMTLLWHLFEVRCKFRVQIAFENLNIHLDT